MKAVLSLMIMGLAQASHFEDIGEIENFKFDHVRFLTKKDCALDSYPDVSTILRCFEDGL